MITSIDQLKALLLKQRSELLATVSSLEVTASQLGMGYTNHQADHATQAFDQAKAQSFRTSSEKRLRLIEDALAKFEAGTYGKCDNCGREIDIARLEAIPYTPLCLPCAENREYQG